MYLLNSWYDNDYAFMGHPFRSWSDLEIDRVEEENRRKRRVEDEEDKKIGEEVNNYIVTNSRKNICKKKFKKE